MQEGLVSIIVPVFKAEPYLAACIESLLNQTYGSLEILLVDDGSPDDCPRICDGYAAKDSRIHVIHQENRGVSAARNAGLARATGEFFTFVDSDDELMPYAVEFLLRDMHEYHADMVSAVKSRVLADGTVTCQYEDHALHIYKDLDMLKLSLDGERQTNSACAKLFRREVFGHLRYVEGKNINEDGFFLFQCYTLKPTVVQHNESIYLYYIRSNSNSKNVFSDKYFDMLYFCELKKEIIERDFPELTDKLVTMEVSVHLFFLEILCRTTDAKYKPAQKASIQIVKKYYRVFQCMNRHERQMARIVAYGLYPIYKRLVRLKYY
jgi:glycosyltransferase involved in cell wall biosynthesis